MGSTVQSDKLQYIHYKPMPCTFTEFRHFQSGQSEFREGTVTSEQLVNGWFDQRDSHALLPNVIGTVRWIFASAIFAPPATHRDILSSDEVLELTISEEVFNILQQRYGFSAVIQAWEHRTSAGFETRHIEYDETTGRIKFITLVVSIRLSTSFASVFAINHEFDSKATLVLGLRTSLYDYEAIKRAGESHKVMIGQPLFAPIILLELSLAANLRYVEKIRQNLRKVERATGYHGWLEIPGTEALALNNELSKLAHATKQQVSLSLRRLNFLQCYLKSIQETRDQLTHPSSSSFTQATCSIDQIEQWLHNIVLLLGQRQADLAYYERQADNQITVIHTLLFQRDSMLALSVARRSQEIAEGSKRDSSALKSLNIHRGPICPSSFCWGATVYLLGDGYFTDTLYFCSVVLLDLRKTRRSSSRCDSKRFRKYECVIPWNRGRRHGASNLSFPLNDRNGTVSIPLFI